MLPTTLETPDTNVNEIDSVENSVNSLDNSIDDSFENSLDNSMLELDTT